MAYVHTFSIGLGYRAYVSILSVDPCFHLLHLEKQTV